MTCYTMDFISNMQQQCYGQDFNSQFQDQHYRLLQSQIMTGILQRLQLGSLRPRPRPNFLNNKVTNSEVELTVTDRLISKGH